MSDTKAVIEEFFARHGARDTSVVDLFADEIEFFTPGDPKYFPWAGRHTRGGQALLPVIQSMWTAGGSLTSPPQLIVDGEDAVWVARGVRHTMPPGTGAIDREPFPMDVAIHFTVRDGKIVRLHTIEDITGMTRAFGLI